MRFFVELLLWHLIIAGFLLGALVLSRGTQNPNRSLPFADDTQAR